MSMWRVWSAAGVASSMVAASWGIAAPASATPIPPANPVPAAAVGAGVVIAQAAVGLDGSPVQWAATSESLSAVGAPLTAAGAVPTFLVTTQGAVLLADGATPQALLGVDEGVFVPVGSVDTIAAIGGVDAVFERVTLTGDAAANGVRGTSFLPSPGVHDVEVRRVAIDPAGSVGVGADGLPVLVVLVAGDVGIVDATGPVGLADDVAATAGAATVTDSSADAPAVVLVVTVGPLAGPGAVGVPATAAPETVAPVTAPPAPASTQPSATTPSPTTTTTTTTTIDPDLDSDGDGLRDTDELQFGTDPNNPDSDGDGLWDAWEFVKGTDPHNPDTDGDQMSDKFEVDNSMNPLNPDTDGDGLIDNVDHEQCNSKVGDTDGDGIDDNSELTIYHTDCRNPDTDGDQMTDGFEVANSMNPLNPDTDGDGLVDNVDHEQCSAVRADTDGDGVDDNTELNVDHTDCRTPN